MEDKFGTIAKIVGDICHEEDIGFQVVREGKTSKLTLQEIWLLLNLKTTTKRRRSWSTWQLRTLTVQISNWLWSLSRLTSIPSNCVLRRDSLRESMMHVKMKSILTWMFIFNLASTHQDVSDSNMLILEQKLINILMSSGIHLESLSHQHNVLWLVLHFKLESIDDEILQKLSVLTLQRRTSSLLMWLHSLISLFDRSETNSLNFILISGEMYSQVSKSLLTL